jgi:hypothetical protein
MSGKKIRSEDDKMLTKMLTYEGVFGEKGFEECCEIEWERKTIEGNVCIRPYGGSYGGYLRGGKYFEEVQEQFVWPGRPALLPDGHLCVPEGRCPGRLQIVVPAEELKCFHNSKKMLEDQGRWNGKEWPSQNLLARFEEKEEADAGGRRAIRAGRVYQTLIRPTCVVASPVGGSVFVLDSGGRDYGSREGREHPAVVNKCSWSEGKLELLGAAEGLELSSAHKGDLALGASALYVLDALKVIPPWLRI